MEQSDICVNCSIKSGDGYNNNTSYYLLAGQVYCGLNCFNIKYKEVDVKREEEPGRTRKASRRKSTTTRSKRSAKKGRRSRIR